MDISACLAVLEAGGVPLDEGLTPAEIAAAEDRFGFTFSPDHRALLEAAQPAGEHWLNWRSDSDERIRLMLDWPRDGLLFDVEHNAFWPETWGPRPPEKEERERIASARIATWPTLIPIFGHRYMPAAPAPSGSPVFSVYQSDVILYGDDLLQYLHHELEQMDPDYFRQPFDPLVCPPWSLIVGGLDVVD